MTTNTLSLLERLQLLLIYQNAYTIYEEKRANLLARSLKDLEAAIAAERSVSEANPYEQAIDDELVNSFLGTKDDFKDAKSALQAVIDWSCKVALDPTVSPEALALTRQAKPSQVNSQEPAIYISFVANSDGDKHIRYWTFDKAEAADFAKRTGAPITEFFTSPQLKPLRDEEIGLMSHKALDTVPKHMPTNAHHFGLTFMAGFKYGARAIEAKLGVGK